MKIANYLKEYLDEYDVDVYLTRTDSSNYVSVLDRGLFIRNKKADIGISLHLNSAPTNLSGAEVWVTNNTSLDKYKKQSTELGNAILKNLTSLGIGNRGVKTRLSTGDTTDAYTDGTRSDYYGVIRYSMRGCRIDNGVISPKGAVPANVQKGEGIPTIIVEHCFVKGNDYNYINSDAKLKKLAEADGKAIVDYYKLRLKREKLGTPTLKIDVGNLNKKSVLNWTGVENANSYNIRIKTGTPGNVVKYKNIWNLQTTSYRKTLPQGYYEIVIEACNDYETTKSNKVCFYIEDENSVPKMVENIAVTPYQNKIVLTWDKVYNAHGYKVYMFNETTQKWERYKKIHGADNTSAKIKDLESGKTYKFRIRAYKDVNGKHLLSADYQTIKTATNPGKVYFKAKSYQKNTLLITWDSVPGATGYKVYYKPNANSDWKKLTTTQGTSFTHTALKSGKTYEVMVQAYIKYKGKYYYGNYKTKTVTIK